MKERCQMRSKTLIIIALLLVLLQIGICTWLYNYTPPISEKIDTVTVSDTIWKTDSFEVVKPIPKYIKVVKTDTITKDTVLQTENKTYTDTLCVQNDTAIVTSNIQGINAELLSTEVMLKKQEITKTNTITITKYVEKPRKLINVQPQCTFGYDPLNRNWGAVVGVGIGINLGGK